MRKELVSHLLKLILLALGAVIIARSGIYPAASTADDAWFAEAGFHLSKGFGLRRPWLNDEFNGANIDFFPPITSVLQGIVFLILGVSQFSVGVLSSLSIVISSLLTYKYLRQNNVNENKALISCISLWGLQIVLEQSVRIRPELWTYIYILGSLMLFKGAITEKNNFKFYVSGVIIGISCINYYPTAPLVLLASIIQFYIYRKKLNIYRNFFYYVLGGMTILLAFLFWIGHDYKYFFLQELSTGSYYLTLSTLIAPIKNIFITPEHGVWQGPVRYSIMCIEALFVLFYTIYIKLVSKSQDVDSIATFVVIPWLVYPMMGSPVLLVVSGSFFIVLLSINDAPFNKRIIFILALCAILKVFYIGYVAYKERASRSYENFLGQINFINKEDAYIAGDRLIWLAFRPNNKNEIFWLVNSKYKEDFIWRSTYLRGMTLDKDMYIIVDKERNLDEMAADYKILEKKRSENKIQFIKEVNCCSGPYNVRVYKVLRD